MDIIKEELALLLVKQVLISGQNKKLKLDLKILLTLTTTNMIFPVCVVFFYSLLFLYYVIFAILTIISRTLLGL